MKITSNDNNPKYTIIVKAFHYSCQSDKINNQRFYGGIIIYSMGNVIPTTGIRWQPGYILIKDVN